MNTPSFPDRSHHDELSQLLEKARTWLEDSPDVREDLIISLRQQIATGNYVVPVEELATRLSKLLITY
jgi:anti-sigma28 factor (negative regulator of flagellin synthesis)